MHSPWIHHTVLLKEAVDALSVQPDGHYIDATFGRGGHSRQILSLLSLQGRLTVFDKDPEAVAEAERLAASDARLNIRHQGFAQLGELPAASFRTVRTRNCTPSDTITLRLLISVVFSAAKIENVRLASSCNPIAALLRTCRSSSRVAV